LVTDDAKEIKVPVALLPAKTDNDMVIFLFLSLHLLSSPAHPLTPSQVPFMDILESTQPEVFKKSVHRRFDDMHHGFAAARGDWNDPLNAQRANEALNIVATFFKSIFYL
jgi:hypothetical protein